MRLGLSYGRLAMVIAIVNTACIIGGRGDVELDNESVVKRLREKVFNVKEASSGDNEDEDSLENSEQSYRVRRSKGSPLRNRYHDLGPNSFESETLARKFASDTLKSPKTQEVIRKIANSKVPRNGKHVKRHPKKSGGTRKKTKGSKGKNEASSKRKSRREKARKRSHGRFKRKRTSERGNSLAKSSSVRGNARIEAAIRGGAESSLSKLVNDNQYRNYRQTGAQDKTFSSTPSNKFVFTNLGKDNADLSTYDPSSKFLSTNGPRTDQFVPAANDNQIECPRYGNETAVKTEDTVSTIVNETRKVAGEMLDRIIDEINELKVNHSGRERQEGSACRLSGDWVATQAGMKFHVSIENRSLIVNLSEIARPQESFLNASWSIKGHMPFRRGAPFSLLATNHLTKAMAVFLGACKVCQGVDTISGLWTISRESSDCRDFQIATTVVNDIFRRKESFPSNATELKKS